MCLCLSYSVVLALSACVFLHSLCICLCRVSMSLTVDSSLSASVSVSSSMRNIFLREREKQRGLITRNIDTQSCHFGNNSNKNDISYTERNAVILVMAPMCTSNHSPRMSFILQIYIKHIWQCSRYLFYV